MIRSATEPGNNALGNAPAVSGTWENQNHCHRSSTFQKVTINRQIQSRGANAFVGRMLSG